MLIFLFYIIWNIFVLETIRYPNEFKRILNFNCCNWWYSYIFALFLEKGQRGPGELIILRFLSSFLKETNGKKWALLISYISYSLPKHTHTHTHPHPHPHTHTHTPTPPSNTSTTSQLSRHPPPCHPQLKRNSPIKRGGIYNNCGSIPLMLSVCPDKIHSIQCFNDPPGFW